MSLSTLDLSLRAATVALLLVLAASLWRDFRHVAAGRLTIALALGTIAHAVTNEIGSTAPVSLWHAPLIALFGNDDMNPSPAQADMLEQALKDNGKDYVFYRYDGAGHGFFYYHMPSYREQQAMDGWDKVEDFFNQNLR